MRYSSPVFTLTFGFFLLVAVGVQAQTDTTRKPTPVPRSAAATVEKGALRIVCEGDNAGAEISINGAAKGRCPFDVEVPAGKVLLRAVKPISSEWERSYEEELTIGAGVARKVDVNVGYRRPTSEMIRRWEAAANAGDAEAMYQLGWVYKWGTTRTIDFVKATSYFRRAAAAGHAAGTREYGEALGWGQGVAINREEAKRLQLKAAELGDGDALARMGSVFYFGEQGFPEDQRKGVEYWQKSLVVGSAEALLDLREIEPDKNKKHALDKRRFEINRRLADAGDMYALQRVSLFYWFGSEAVGIQSADVKHAELSAPLFAFRLKAAATGDTFSLIQLGDSYRDGRMRGAPKDKFLAEQAYRAAIANGSDDAKSRLKELLAK